MEARFLLAQNNKVSKRVLQIELIDHQNYDKVTIEINLAKDDGDWYIDDSKIIPEEKFGKISKKLKWKLRVFEI